MAKKERRKKKNGLKTSSRWLLTRTMAAQFTQTSDAANLARLMSRLPCPYAARVLSLSHTASLAFMGGSWRNLVISTQPSPREQ